MIRTLYFSMLCIACSFSEQETVEIIDATQLQKLQSDGVSVFDIRTLDEYNAGHIAGVIHVDFYDETFTERMKKFAGEKSIVIHCASGGRSRKASQMLLQAGFDTIYDYSGGFSDWKSKGLDVE